MSTPSVSATASTPPAAATATDADQGSAAADEYVDNRSSADALIASFYNAINRHEYARAYSYWEPGASADQLPPFEQFAQGYASTASVAITLGPIGGDVGAGQLYYSVPVALAATQTDGSTAHYAGCYVLHLGRPQIQTQPPFQGLAIRSATVNTVASAADAQSQLPDACAGQGSASTNPVVTPSALSSSIDAAVYIDDRSSPQRVLNSLYNAVNSQEYARAYSYWEADAAGLAPFDQFQAGYQSTHSVTLKFGATQADPGAGQLNYSQPVAVIATQTDGTTQTFVGCYQLHLAQPAIQAAPPFQPLAIHSGTLAQVDNSADLDTLLATGCQP
jgi:hypothetical protein